MNASALFILQSLLQSVQNYFVRSLSLPISLGIGHTREVLFDLILVAKFAYRLVLELSPIVGDESFGDAKPSNNVLLKETFDIRLPNIS